MLFFSLFQNGDVIEGVATKRNGYLTLSVFEKLLKGKAAKGKSTVRGKSVSSIHRINLTLSVKSLGHIKKNCINHTHQVDHVDQETDFDNVSNETIY